MPNIGQKHDTAYHPTFPYIRHNKKSCASLAIYLKLNSVDISKSVDKLNPTVNLFQNNSIPPRPIHPPHLELVASH